VESLASWQASPLQAQYFCDPVRDFNFRICLCYDFFALICLLAFTCGLFFLASEQEVYSLILPVVSIVSLNPNFITGFSDAEGCFYIQISKDNRCQTGYQVIASFTIGLDKRDIALLKEIQLFFFVQVKSIPTVIWSIIK
jgi:hypothetical protein